MKKVIRPRKQQKIDEQKSKMKNFYSKEELQKFLQCAEQNSEKELSTIFHTLAFTGLRKSELMALRWKDINIQTGTLSVNQTIVYGENNLMKFQTPKTQKSMRTISLDIRTLNILKSW
ncbi:TPA: site-specific integrase, partial [Streptococcus suis]|nr:site-specific integrase [Streptococcus suis]